MLLFLLGFNVFWRSSMIFFGVCVCFFFLWVLIWKYFGNLDFMKHSSSKKLSSRDRSGVFLSLRVRRQHELLIYELMMSERKHHCVVVWLVLSITHIEWLSKRNKKGCVVLWLLKGIKVPSKSSSWFELKRDQNAGINIFLRNTLIFFAAR